MGARPDRTDLSVSLAFATFGLVEIWLTPTPGLSADRAGESVGLVLISGCIAFRRTLPVPSALAVLLLLLGVGVLWTDSRLWEIAAVLLVCYSGARHASLAGAWVVLLASTVGGIVATAAEDNDNVWQFVGNYLFYMGLFLVVPWTAGLALRRRQQLGRHDAEQAVVEERARIARELHDVVGHALGMIVVQAEGERAQLARTHPSRPARRWRPSPTARRDALDDVRRLLMIMRAENELGPQPGLRDVPRLLDGLSSAGLPVELSVSGASRQLPAGIDLSAYRVVQEALTNVLRHSRGAHAPRAAAVRPGRDRDRGHRRRPRRAGRRVARVRPAGHAGAGRTVRRQRRGRPASGWRLRGPRAPADARRCGR